MIILEQDLTRLRIRYLTDFFSWPTLKMQRLLASWCSSLVHCPHSIWTCTFPFQRWKRTWRRRCCAMLFTLRNSTLERILLIRVSTRQLQLISQSIVVKSYTRMSTDRRYHCSEREWGIVLVQHSNVLAWQDTQRRIRRDDDQWNYER